MYCTKCGNKNLEQSKFCDKCGEKFGEREVTEIKIYNNDYKRSKNKGMFFILLFLLGIIDIATYDYVEATYEVTDVGALSLAIGGIVGSIFSSVTLVSIIMSITNFIFSFAIIWLIVAVVMFNTSSRQKRGVDKRGESTGNSFEYLKWVYVVMGVSTIIIFVVIVTAVNRTNNSKEIDSFTATNNSIVTRKGEPVKKTENNIQDILSSVVNIYCEYVDENNLTETDFFGGSGTIVSKDGLIITNSHIIPQDDKGLLTLEDGCLVYLPNAETGSSEEIYVAEPIVYDYYSEKYDLAYLKIKKVYIDEMGEKYGEYPRKFPAYKNSQACKEKKVKLGEDVRVYGYPVMSGGMSLTITDGIISSLPGEGLIMTSAKIDEGNSGGIALDSVGCIVGVPSSVITGEFENMGVIISENLVEKFNSQISSDLIELEYID